MLRVAPGPGPVAEEGAEEAPRKKRRGHDERHVSSPIRALKRPSFLVECARLAQVLVMPMQAQVNSGGGLRLEEPGSSSTSITAYTFLRYSLYSNKQVHKTSDTNKARNFARKISSSCPMHAFRE
jgi:hypothetical protein